MEKRNFRKLLENRWSKGKFVCVGLDSELNKIPVCVHEAVGNRGAPFHSTDTIVAFNKAIVQATKDLTCAYKPNSAFYEAQNIEGIAALQTTIAWIHVIAPDIPVILDAKRADIGNTNAGYVDFAFNYLQADAITVHPYLGQEAMQPFLDCKDKGVIVLCRTSNPGASEFQDWGAINNQGNPPLYKRVAFQVRKYWNKNDNCALVVGATYPDELREVRELVRDVPILIPGVGFQQKDVPLEKQVEQVVSAGKDSRGRGMIINSSRGIIFASSGSDFAEAARRETEKLHNLINQYR